MWVKTSACRCSPYILNTPPTGRPRLFSHVDDPFLNEPLPREFVLYLRPSGPLLHQLSHFWQQSRLICGKNKAHNIFPHITLCQFFMVSPLGWLIALRQIYAVTCWISLCQRDLESYMLHSVQIARWRPSVKLWSPWWVSGEVASPARCPWSYTPPPASSASLWRSRSQSFSRSLLLTLPRKLLHKQVGREDKRFL